MSPVIAIATCAVAVSVQAAYMEGRSCKESDLPGLWKNVSITEEPVGAVTAAFKVAPHEYMLFDGKGKLAYEARTTAANIADEDQLAALMNEVVAASAKAGKFNEKVTKDGKITLSHNDKPWAEFKCVIAQLNSEEADIKFGDMVWYSVEGVSPYLKRVERKISRPVAL